MSNLKSLENEIMQFVNDYSKPICHKAGLAGMMNSFYYGSNLRPCEASADEIAKELELSEKEYSLWKDIFYKKIVD